MRKLKTDTAVILTGDTSSDDYDGGTRGRIHVCEEELVTEREREREILKTSGDRREEKKM